MGEVPDREWLERVRRRHARKHDIERMLAHAEKEKRDRLRFATAQWLMAREDGNEFVIEVADKLLYQEGMAVVKGE